MYVIAVDVGTLSCRASVVSQENGNIVSRCDHQLKRHCPLALYFEQSFQNIWSCVCACVKQAIIKSQVAKEQIVAISFDATCSLVVMDEDLKPLCVSPTKTNDGDDDDVWNVIMWMDHRAEEEANFINECGNEDVLMACGGVISPEMEPPKLLWLKKHKPAVWRRAKKCMDLTDALSVHALERSDVMVRSACTTTCKWLYQNHSKQWSSEFWKSIGLPECVEDNFARIGAPSTIHAISSKLGTVGASVAKQMGVCATTVVACGLIDAHAGAVGMLGMALPPTMSVPLNERLAVISGTSTCYMHVARGRTCVPGVWGPYYEAVMPNTWLLEGGQSASGALLDHMIQSHPAYSVCMEEAEAHGVSTYEYLENFIETTWNNDMTVTSHLHLLPDFVGNRSPLADSSIRGMICGLSLRSSDSSDNVLLGDLALIYLTTIQAIAFGTKHVIDALSKYGVNVKLLCMCGGLTKSRLFVQTHSDICECPCVVPEHEDCVLVGTAMCASIGTNDEQGDDVFLRTMERMQRPSRFVSPQNANMSYYRRKYSVFCRMYDDQRAYQALMNAKEL